MTVKAYFLPESIEEAVSLLSEHGSNLMVSGGGTHTMMLINNGHAMPETVMGLRHAGIDRITVNGGITIGAMTTMSQIMQANTGDFLHQAAHSIGGWAVRNMATVGGNLMMPQPAGDFAAALLALDAKVKLVSKNGERTVSLVDFYDADSRLNPGELITEIQAQKPSDHTAYMKYARRDANAPAMVTVAVNLKMNGHMVSEVRIALNGAAPTPIRATDAEKVLNGNVLEPDIIAKAAEAAASQSQPYTDALATQWYRRKMVNVFVRRALESLA